MKKQNNNPEEVANLRQKAEELLQRKDKACLVSTSATEHDLLKLIHELEVYQIELEMQNEELVIAKEKADLAEEKYTELFDFATSGYVVLSKKGDILKLNFAAARILGKERIKLIENRFALFVSIDTQKTFALFLHDVCTSKVKLSCEVIIATEGKLPIYVNIEGVISKNDEFCLLTLRDITESIRAKKELQGSEEKFRVLIESTSVGIYLTDLNGKCTYVNPKWCEIAHLTYNEALGDGWVNGIYEEDRDKVVGNWEKMIASDGNWGFEYRFGTPDKISWVYGTAKSYKNDSGQIAGYIGSNVDFTGRKHSDMALLAKVDELERFFKITVGRETSMVALKKEVNNLLNKLGQANKYTIHE